MSTVESRIHGTLPYFVNKMFINYAVAVGCYDSCLSQKSNILTSACCPGCRTLPHSSHFKHHGCQSNPSDCLLSAENSATMTTSSNAEIWCRYLDANQHLLQGFNESSTSTYLTGVKYSSKPWGQPGWH